MSRTLLVVCSLFIVVITTTSIAAEPDAKPIPGVGPAGEVVRLHTDFKFVEGPAVDAYENVYFSDIPNDRILKVDADGKLSTFLEDSHAINGLMFDRRGRLIACQGKKQRIVVIDAATKEIAPLAEMYEGKPLGTPNDLVIDRQGGVYFTTPDTSAVYYADEKGAVVRLLNELPRPNGVILSPDEATLYVLPSGSGDVMSYPVKSPGQIGEGRVFCQLVPNSKNPSRPGGDGLTVDAEGNLYLTRPSMKLIQVVDPNGKTLGLLHFPEEPSNCTFGGADRKTLYVTAQTSLYSQRMETAGHRFSTLQPESWDYVEPMKQVAARFRGNEGVVLHVGGSMTIANPYGTWPRSGQGKTGDDRAILDWMHLEKKDKADGWWLCRTEIEHYRAYTSESGLKSAMLLAGGRRGLPKLAKLLDEYQPQMVTIECGIYDVEDGVPLEEYQANMTKAVDIILAHGAIPILNTVPQFKAQFETTQRYNVALRELARQRGIPVVDLEAEIFSLRPDDWYDKLVDRIHLTAAQAGVSPGAEPTTANLRNSGYLLRGWLTVRKIAEVKHRVIDRSTKRSAADVSVTNIKTLHRDGQTFVTWKDALEGEAGADYRYDLYVSDRPITQASLADLKPAIHGLVNNSGKEYGYHMAAKRRLDASLPMASIESGGKPLPQWTGLAVRTVEKEGDRYYAVVASDLEGKPVSKVTPGQSATTVAVSEKPAPIQPVKTGDSRERGRYANVVQVTGKQNLPLLVQLHASSARGGPGSSHGDYYLFWGRPEWGYRDGLPWQFAVEERKFGQMQDRRLMLSARETIAQPDGDGARETYWFGYYCVPQWANHEEPRAYNFTERRMLWLIDWVRGSYHADPNRIYAEGGSMGAWGTTTFALRHPDVFAAVYPNRPRTKQRGLPSMAKVDRDAPILMSDGKTDYYDRMNMVKFVSQHPEDLSFIGWCCGRHDGFATFKEQIEMVEALTAAHHGFAFAWNDGDHSSGSTAMSEVMRWYPPEKFARNQSYPAFGNSSIDQDLGSGEVEVEESGRTKSVLNEGNGALTGGINLGFVWNDVIDENEKWSVTLSNELAQAAMSVDVTPRRCQNFKPRSGEQLSLD